jgi:hypothetical protein
MIKKDTFTEHRLHLELFKPRKDSKRGYVYIIKANGLYKIGVTTHPKKRLRGYMVSLPCEVSLVLCVEVDDYCKMEWYLQNTFQNKRVKGEWFELNEGDLNRIASYVF